MIDKQKIVFYGEVVEGQNLETVKKNLGALFKMDADKIDRLLSKPPVLIKKDIDFQTALKYQEILKKAGAICKIEPMISEQKTVPVSTQTDKNQEKYELIFYGELEIGEDPITVKKRLADLFKTDISKIDKYLSQLPAIIKKNVDLETALKYREAIKKAGAICLIKPVKSAQSTNTVLVKSEKSPVSTPVSPPPTQTNNIPSSPEPAINQQSSSESAKSRVIQYELSNLPGTENKASDPSGEYKTENVQASEQTQSPSNHLVCPQCHFKQESSDKCVRCGFTMENFCKPTAQTLSPQGNDSEKFSSEVIAQSPENQSIQHSESFFKRLFYLNKVEWKEIQILIIGSAIIGAIVGYIGGGLYDPWQNQRFAAAILNFLLFGGWAMAEAGGLIVARNLRNVKSRKKLIFAGSLCGGTWVGLFTALELVADPSSLGPVLLKIILGLIIGFIIGGLISAICTIKLSGIMSAHGEDVDSLEAVGKTALQKEM